MKWRGYDRKPKKSAQRKYHDFHGRTVQWKKKFDFHTPKTLIILGKAIAVEYECDKLHGGGDGKKAIYRHEIETPAYVCMDETGRRQLYIVGNKLKVTEAGIEN